MIDARSADSSPSGIGNYTAHLVSELAAMGAELDITLVRRRGWTKPLAPNARVVLAPGDTKSAWTPAIGPLLRLHAARTSQSDGRYTTSASSSQSNRRDAAGAPFSQDSSPNAARVYHSPADLVPFGAPRPWVVTLHDLMWIEAPELCSAHAPERRVNALWYRLHIERAVRGARRLIAISQATADAIRRVFPSAADKVRVVHHGVDHERFSALGGEPRELIDAWVPRGVRYWLIVGQGSPYKNHAGMIRAYLDALGERADQRLVLVRRFSRVDKELSELLARPEVARRVIQIPAAPGEVLLALYRHAHAVLFASHEEGFGLPALEAMAMGVPVLTSTAPALVEVTQGGALHAPSRDHAALVDALRAMDSGDDLIQRLRQRGPERARQFSWRRTAEQTLAVYREASD